MMRTIPSRQQEIDGLTLRLFISEIGEEAERKGSQPPEHAYHEVGIIRGKGKVRYGFHLFDLKVDRYSGKPQLSNYRFFSAVFRVAWRRYSFRRE